MRSGIGFRRSYLGKRSRRARPRYVSVRRGRALAGPVRRVVARIAGRAVRALAPGIRTVSALAPSRGVAPGAGLGAKRDGLAPAYGRLDGRTRAMKGRRGKEMTALLARRSAADEVVLRLSFTYTATLTAEFAPWP